MKFYIENSGVEINFLFELDEKCILAYNNDVK